jgi:hypothetical protein
MRCAAGACRQWKQKVLNREIELEEIDVTPHMSRVGVGKGVTIDKLVANG